MTDDKDDNLLFRESVGPVRRVRSSRTESRPTPAPARAQKRAEDERRVLAELGSAGAFEHRIETGEEISWLRPGLQKRILVRLKRGHWSVQDEIDLHRMNTDAATRSIRIFIDEARTAGKRCVRIIHGKGLRSGPAGPRLKTLAARVLSRHPRVLAFASAPPADGGTGALYVLLEAA